MYVFALELRHFRSFEDLWVFPKDDINVLVGPNNCGKSTVLRALALLLDPAINLRRPDVVSRFDFYSMDIGNPIELRVWLKPRSRPSRASLEPANYSGATESEEIKLAFFDRLSEWQLEMQQQEDHCSPEEQHPRRLSPFTIDPMTEPDSVPVHEKLLAIRLRASWDDEEGVAEVEVSVVDQMDSDLCPLSTVQKELLGFKLIGARRDPLYELSLARRSTLAQMLKEEEITRALRKLLDNLDQGKQPLLDEPSVKDLLNQLNSLIDPQLMTSLLGGEGSGFTLTFLGGDLWRLRGATSIATNTRTQGALPLEYQGDGIQNLLLLSHLAALLRNEERNHIVALEEPEHNLEPALARSVFAALCSLADRAGTPNAHDGPSVAEHGGVGTRCGQVFVTTHSPALVNELTGSESLIIFAEGSTERQEKAEESADESGATKSRRPCMRWRTISARYLSPDHRKKLDQRRERYVSALFARHVLIVEGDSEVGFLPVAFCHLTRAKPYGNPFYLGLEVMDGDSKSQLPGHAEVLSAYGRKCHLLLDYDGKEDDIEELRSRFGGKADFVTCWPRESPLDFANGCDLEVILAADVPPEVLLEAIQYAYDDAGHELLLQEWVKACKKINDPAVPDQFPPVFDCISLRDVKLEKIGSKRAQQAFLFALLHGPHSCKAVKDMRMIAQVLARHDAFPKLIDDLRQRILKCIVTPEEIDHDQPYLASNF